MSCQTCSLCAVSPGMFVPNGPEFVAKAIRDWIGAVGAKTAYIEPGSPWENGYCESFNSKLRDELLDGEIFYTLEEARVIIENWRRCYNEIRPHSSLGYRPPAPRVLMTARPAAQPEPASPAAPSLAQRSTLTNIQTGSPCRGRPSGLTDRAIRGIRTRRVIFWLMMAIAVVVGATVGIAIKANS